MKNTKRQGSALIIVIAALALAAIGGLAYYALAPKPTPSPSPLISVAAATPTPTPADPYAGWKTYENARYKYSFKYPATWALKDCATDEISEIAGAVSIDRDSAHQFHCGSDGLDTINFRIQQSADRDIPAFEKQANVKGNGWTAKKTVLTDQKYMSDVANLPKLITYEVVDSNYSGVELLVNCYQEGPVTAKLPDVQPDCEKIVEKTLLMKLGD